MTQGFVDNFEFTTRYCETDQMGVVNHARYFDWFSEGRVSWLKSQGFLYSEWEKEGLVLPVVDCRCQFKKSAYFQEKLKLQTRVSELKRKIISFSYELKNESGDLLARASTRHVFLKDGGMISMEPEVYSRFQEAVGL